ncbi:MAG: hypothetical protein ACXVHB_25790 [Solirubrobacteraceae bacterium]
MTREQLDKAMTVAAKGRLDNKTLAAATRAQAALDKIDAKHRAALLDRDKALRAAHLQGATVRQLAEMVKLSPAAVSKAVRRTS